MINAVYGKTMENVRGRVDIRLRTDWKGRYGAYKLVALPNFKRFNVFDEDLVAIELNKTCVIMDKPIIIGMAILDISKVTMYDFYYSNLKKEYDENVCMLYTDTDSFVLEVSTKCFYTDIKKDLSIYDTSGFKENNQFDMPRVNKKVPGLFKDELKGQIITEFVGLRSKMYCVRIYGDEKEMKKAEGVKTYVLKNSITFDDYVKCLNNIDKDFVISRSQNTIRSINHHVYSIKQSKIALSPYDNKRYICADKIHTLPWGHYDIPNQIDRKRFAPPPPPLQSAKKRCVTSQIESEVK